MNVENRKNRQFKKIVCATVLLMFSIGQGGLLYAQPGPEPGPGPGPGPGPVFFPGPGPGPDPGPGPVPVPDMPPGPGPGPMPEPGMYPGPGPYPDPSPFPGPEPFPGPPPGPVPFGEVFFSLPHDAFQLFVGGAAFFYHAGAYYKKMAGKYVVVEPPVGARVKKLPPNCTHYVRNGQNWYACGNSGHYYWDGSAYVVAGGGAPVHENRPPAEIGDKVKVTADKLNVRSGPGKKYRIVRTIYWGDVVKVTDVEKRWYQVRFVNGRYGWIHSRFTRPFKFHKGGGAKG